MSSKAQAPVNAASKPSLNADKSGLLQRKCNCGNSAGLTGKCAECQKENLTPQRKQTGTQDEVSEVPAIVHEVLNSPGHPLDLETRTFMESRFKHDFSQVRVHTDAKAAESARASDALAYTVGQHIVFGSNRFSPRTHDGRKLLAHELSHTIQQARISSCFAEKLEIGSVGDTYEQEADAAADRVSHTNQASRLVSTQEFSSLQRHRVQRVIPKLPTTKSPASPADIHLRLVDIIRNGGPVPTDTRVIGAAIIEVESGYSGPNEMRSISGSSTDALSKGASVYHALSPDERTMSATRSIAGAGHRREFPFSHINDAEIKLFEDIAPRLSKNARGTIYYLTMRVRRVEGQIFFEPYPACSGCIRASFEMAGQVRPVELVSFAPTQRTGTIDFGNLENKPPEFNELPKPNIEQEIPKTNLGLGEPDALPKGGLSRAGRIGAIALEGVANIALELALLASQIIIELVILPKLERWKRKLEEGRRQYIQEQIQKKFDDFESKHIGRILKSCYLKQLREMEKTGKKAYVIVELMVSFEDTSNRFRLPFSSLTPPGTFFDIEFNDVRLSNVTLRDKPIESLAGPLNRCESCGLFGRDRTFVTNNPLWEQKVSFSFEAPKSSTIASEFEKEPDISECAADIACFIATACYGSLLAPQVETLRRFRNRILLTNWTGRLFVRIYYFVSPPIALWLTTHEQARHFIRCRFVEPLAWLVHKMGWD